MNMKPTEKELDALHRLMEHALSEDEDALESAKFLMSWDGHGFQACEVTANDARSADMYQVFRMLARTRQYPQALGYANDLAKIRRRLPSVSMDH